VWSLKAVCPFPEAGDYLVMMNLGQEEATLELDRGTTVGSVVSSDICKFAW